MPPLYDYECKKCGRELEISHSIHEDARKKEDHTDPKGLVCRGKLKRLLSVALVTWKGGKPTPKHYC